MRSTIFALLLIVVCSIFFFGSGNKMSDPAKIEVNAAHTDDKRLTFYGTTNLPDGTNLKVRFTNKFTDKEVLSQTFFVKNGEYLSNPIGDKESLNPGQYEGEIYTLSTKDQPDSVRAVIGQSGEYLKGPLLKEEWLSGKVIKLEFNFDYGTPAEIKAAEEQYKIEKAEEEKKIAEIITEVKALVREGRGMEKYRTADYSDMESARKCGKKMRALIAKADKVKDKTFALGNIDGFFNLRMAASGVWRCVNCSSEALTFCDEVEADLRKYEDSRL